MSHHIPRALIAEDEPILAAALAHALQRLWPELDIVATCPNGVEALRQGLALQPDILFLDIKMPGKTGLEAAEELAEQWPDGIAFPHIVFVTAYDQFALDAFEQAAVDYVLKPVQTERLAETVKRLKDRLTVRPSSNGAADPAQTLAELVERLAGLQGAAQTRVTPQGGYLRFIKALVGQEVRFIPVDDVLYLEATDKYVNVVASSGESLIRMSLRELLAQLDPEHFWQVHRGTLVNVRQIASAKHDSLGRVSLQLKDRSESLAVSRSYAHLFRQM